MLEVIEPMEYQMPLLLKAVNVGCKLSVAVIKLEKTLRLLLPSCVVLSPQFVVITLPFLNDFLRSLYKLIYDNRCFFKPGHLLKLSRDLRRGIRVL